ncbi:hypothetical protein H7F16_02100 [Gemmobacter straminiformis]|uniref:Lipoprotein n=2 Tax=Paragemmobacter straminiformis TaxID=2045119 RepID=A0A842I304_9RHOB|nr:hypothetical protein [Gemmobacter straminiformis]
MMRGLALGLSLLTLAACGPVTVEQAERQCFERARLAAGPRGEVGVGVGSDGRMSASVDVTVTSDYLGGRDPAAVFDACVYQKSGQPPSRPLYSFPEWKG